MSQEELNLDVYARAIWRAKWVILIVAIASGAVAAYWTYRQPVQHKAVALIRIGRVWKEPLEDYVVAEKVAGSQGFLREAAASAGLTPRQLRRSVRVETLQGGSRRNRYPVLLQVTATSESDDANQLAEAVANQIVARHAAMFEEALKPHLEQQQRLEERQKELSSQPASRDLLLKLESELDTVRANNSLSNTPVTEKTYIIGTPASEQVARQSIWRPAAAAALIMGSATALFAALAARFRQQSGQNQDAQNS
jgi:hypothetical protein